MSSWNCHIIATCNEKQRQDQSKAFYQFDFFDLILNSTYNDNYSDFLGLKLSNFLILLHTHPILPCLAQYLLATNFALQNRNFFEQNKEYKAWVFFFNIYSISITLKTINIIKQKALNLFFGTSSHGKLNLH